MLLFADNSICWHINSFWLGYNYQHEYFLVFTSAFLISFSFPTLAGSSNYQFPNFDGWIMWPTGHIYLYAVDDRFYLLVSNNFCNIVLCDSKQLDNLNIVMLFIKFPPSFTEWSTCKMLNSENKLQTTNTKCWHHIHLPTVGQKILTVLHAVICI